MYVLSLLVDKDVIHETGCGRERPVIMICLCLLAIPFIRRGINDPISCLLGCPLRCYSDCSMVHVGQPSDMPGIGIQIKESTFQM